MYSLKIPWKCFWKYVVGRASQPKLFYFIEYHEVEPVQLLGVFSPSSFTFDNIPSSSCIRSFFFVCNFHGFFSHMCVWIWKSTLKTMMRALHTSQFQASFRTIFKWYFQHVYEALAHFLLFGKGRGGRYSGTQTLIRISFTFVNIRSILKNFVSAKSKIFHRRPNCQLFRTIVALSMFDICKH